MKKQAGLWIDHRKAVIVLVTDEGDEVKTIISDMEKHVRFTNGNGSELGSSEDRRDRQFGNQLDAYYDRVVAVVRGTDAIHIFGPGEAKGELVKRLDREGLKERVLTIEAADKMTEPQIAVKAREYFSTAHPASQ